MVVSKLSPVYNHLLDFVVEKATPQEVLAFELSEAEKQRAIELLDKQDEDALTPDEATELEQMRMVERLLLALKARAMRATR